MKRQPILIVGLVALVSILGAAQAEAVQECAPVKVTWTATQPYGPGTLWESEITLRARGHKLVGTGYWISGPSTLTPRALFAAFGWGTWEFPGIGTFNMWSIGELVPFNLEFTAFGWEGTNLVVGCGDVPLAPLPPPPYGPSVPYCTAGTGGFFELAYGTITDVATGHYDELGQGAMTGTSQGRLCGVSWKDVP